MSTCAAFWRASARPFVTYGFGESADIRAVKVRARWAAVALRGAARGPRAAAASPSICPGRHNVLNSLAAVAVATELDVPDAAIQRALANFQGIDRRLQQLGEIQWAGGTRAARR